MPLSALDGGLGARFRAATGEERSAVFEEIFRTHRSQVFGLCSRLCGQAALAEDATQETFMEVFKGLPLFRDESSLGTWIYRVALRTALRVRSRTPHLPDTGVDAIAVATKDPEATLAAREDMRAVQLALDGLPAEQRVVIALFSIEGLSHGEIAAILGVPEGTVWSRLHKGRKALIAALE